MRIKRRTWATNIKGWWIGATVGQVWGIGITWYGQYNGIAIYLLPLCIDIAPPAPAWAKF